MKPKPIYPLDVDMLLNATKNRIKDIFKGLHDTINECEEDEDERPKYHLHEALR